MASAALSPRVGKAVGYPPLPFELQFDVGTNNVHLVHGSPRKVNEYLFEEKPASLYARLARGLSTPPHAVPASSAFCSLSR